ncbi:hypothetical protein [Vibrio sp. D431a]|uniref:hypothetical protein n=1 Tax=Vibrio sp. D431a TaxID=2837388 RepID=UPI002555FCAD|nr:hypothetical protein [Vibrio sp. D431a]MDK9789832.1 hypothetical protein [Vibrio sp. D431a]
MKIKSKNIQEAALKESIEILHKSNRITASGCAIENKYLPYFLTKYPNTCPIQSDEKTKRWSLPIPVQTNGIRRAEKALKLIEKSVGLKMFEFVHAVENRGVVFNEGFANEGVVNQDGEILEYKVTKNSLGCVNTNPEASEIYYHHKLTGSPHNIDGVYYVNLGSHKRKGGARDYSYLSPLKSHEIATHEMMHVLGMFGHVDGFGEGNQRISKGTLRALKLLYQNDAGTPYDSLKFQ